MCLAEVTLEKLQKRLGNLSRNKNDISKGETTVLVSQCAFYLRFTPTEENGGRDKGELRQKRAI